MTVMFRPAVDAELCGTFPDPSTGLPRGTGLPDPRAWALSHYVDTIGGDLGFAQTIAASIDDTGASVDNTHPVFELEPALIRTENGVTVVYPRGELVQGMLGAPVWIKVAQHAPGWSEPP